MTAGAEKAFTRVVNLNSQTLVLVLSALAVAINVVGGTMVAKLNLSFLFLDTLGTFFIAALFGFRWGALTGVVTNLILGVTDSPQAIPFFVVQLAIAAIVATVAVRIGYTLWSALGCGIAIGIVAPMIGTVIASYVYGGLTGGHMDMAVLALRNAGNSMFVSAFLPRLGRNMIDKVLTALLVWALIQALPKGLIKPLRRETVDPRTGEVLAGNASTGHT